MGFFYEAVTQLRGEAGDRQVAERQDGGRRHRRRHPLQRRHPPTRRRLTELGSSETRPRANRAGSAEVLFHFAEVGRGDRAGSGIGGRGMITIDGTWIDWPAVTSPWSWSMRCSTSMNDPLSRSRANQSRRTHPSAPWSQSTLKCDCASPSPPPHSPIVTTVKLMPGCSTRQWSASRFERRLGHLVDAESAPRRGVRRAGGRHVDHVADRLLEVRERGLADVARADHVGGERRDPLLGRRVRSRGRSGRPPRRRSPCRCRPSFAAASSSAALHAAWSIASHSMAMASWPASCAASWILSSRRAISATCSPRRRSRC